MNWLTAITGSALALVSVTCSAIFYSSYAITMLDTIIASIIATALVVSGHVFFIALHRDKNRIKWAHAFIVCVLVVINTGATVGWLESRYQSNRTSELKADSTYTAQQQRLSDLNDQIAQLRTLAAIDTENGYRDRAARTLRNAEQMDETRAQILRELKHHKAQTASAATSIGNALDDSRWYAWTLIAALIELCSMLCFATITANKAQAEAPNATNKTANETTVTPRATASVTALQTVSKPAPQLAATIVTHNALLNKIKDEIIGGRYGDAPPIRHVMEAHGIRHDRASAIFQELERTNVITRSGHRFYVTNRLEQA